MNTYEITTLTMDARQSLKEMCWGGGFKTERIDTFTFNVKVPDKDVDQFTDWCEENNLPYRLI